MRGPIKLLSLQSWKNCGICVIWSVVISPLDLLFQCFRANIFSNIKQKSGEIQCLASQLMSPHHPQKPVTAGQRGKGGGATRWLTMTWLLSVLLILPKHCQESLYFCPTFQATIGKYFTLCSTIQMASTSLVRKQQMKTMVYCVFQSLCILSINMSQTKMFKGFIQLKKCITTINNFHI